MTATAPGKGGTMDVGIDSFVSLLPDRATGEPPSPDRRLALLLEEIVVADRAGVAIFGVGEHQRKEFVDAATTVVLAAAAARTTDIRLTSSVTVLGAADPVRVFQDFAALDLISGGRAEITVGRGAFHEAFPLFGLHQHDPDALFSEKLDLLLKLRAGNHIEWSGHYRPRLSGQGVFPRPLQARLPIRLGVGGTPASFVRAGTLGLPLMLAIIGGAIPAYRPLLEPVPRRRRARGSPARGSADRDPCEGPGCRRRHRRTRRVLPGIPSHHRHAGGRTRLATADASTVRRRLRPGRSVLRRCRFLRHRQDVGSVYQPRRIGPDHVRDQFGVRRSSGHAAIRRVAGNPRRAPLSRLWLSVRSRRIDRSGLVVR